MPKADDTLTTTPTRRAMLGRMAAAAPVAALAGVPAEAHDPDADLLAAGRRLAEADEESHRRYLALDDAGCRSPWADPVIRETVDRCDATLAEIAALEARTPAGLLVKARIVRDEIVVGHTGFGEAVAEGLVADLERMALTGRA